MNARKKRKRKLKKGVKLVSVLLVIMLILLSAAVGVHLYLGTILNRMNNDVRTVNEGLLSVVPDFLSMITRLTAAALMLVRRIRRVAA